MAVSPLTGSDGPLKITIRCDGEALPEFVQLISIKTSHRINRIAAATIIVADGDMPNATFPVSDMDCFQPGARVEILAGYEANGAPIFSGVVVRHGVRISGDNDARLVIECRDPAHAMTAGCNSAHYAGQADHQVIAALAARAGLRAIVEPTAIVHEALVQYRLSDWDFMLARAAANGMLVTVDGGAVTVAAPAPDAAPVLSVTYGADLLAFDAELQAPSPCDSDAPGACTRGHASFQGSALARPGVVVSLSGVGRRFNGNVVVSEVVHLLADGNWTSEIVFGLAAERLAEAGQPRLQARDATAGGAGLHTGVVLQRDADPQGQCRILVALPDLEDGGGLWARLSTFYGASGAGAFFIPEIGDEVILGFFDQDPARPVILGSLYDSAHLPPFQPGADNHLKALVTRSRLTMAFDDASKEITLTTPGENKVVLSDATRSILLLDQHGNRVELGPHGILLDSRGDITVNAVGKVTIAGAHVAVAARMDVAVTGLNIEQHAAGAFTATGGASAALSAAGQTTVKGAMVLIN